MHAVFLPFLVVAVWQSYDAARSNVAEEAASLTTLYRSTAAMEQAAGRQMRQLIRGYVEAVTSKEWSIQAAAGGARSVHTLDGGVSLGGYDVNGPRLMDQAPLVDRRLD
jgi:hypothetical protein